MYQHVLLYTHCGNLISGMAAVFRRGVSQACLTMFQLVFIVTKSLEQRINTKFCVKIGKSAGETLALLTLAYG
jgi:hypothetical protein